LRDVAAAAELGEWGRAVCALFDVDVDVDVDVGGGSSQPTQRRKRVGKGEKRGRTEVVGSFRIQPASFLPRFLFTSFPTFLSPVPLPAQAEI
jgi:hypothetical protein